MRAEDIRLGAIYATQTVRTWQTAMPSARASGVPITPYAFPPQIGNGQALVQTWKTRHAGDKVLVIGHSNTVGPIVEAFGGSVDPPIGNDFNNLLVISIRNGETSIVRRTFGAIQNVGEVQVTNPIENRDNISGIAVTPNGHLILVGDESNNVQILLKDGAGYTAQPAIAIGAAGADEMDFEGIASHGNTYFVVGSHAWRRRQIYGSHTQRPEAERRERFEKESPDREPSREQVMRLELDPVTHQLANSPIRRDLNHALRTHEVTKPCYGMPDRDILGIPSKENGVDIEGIAFDGTDLYVGLRGPVLRWNFVPVLVVNFEQLDNATMRYVQLDGRGIRDLARVPNGFLILAGPNGDEPLSYELYFWNGKDCFPGFENRPSDNIVLLPNFRTKFGGFYSWKNGIAFCNKIDYAILVKPFHNMPIRFPRKIKAFKNPATAAKGRKSLALPGDA